MEGNEWLGVEENTRVRVTGEFGGWPEDWGPLPSVSYRSSHGTRPATLTVLKEVIPLFSDMKTSKSVWPRSRLKQFSDSAMFQYHCDWSWGCMMSYATSFIWNRATGAAKEEGNGNPFFLVVCESFRKMTADRCISLGCWSPSLRRGMPINWESTDATFSFHSTDLECTTLSICW